jgi:hypothetical protein
MQLARSRFRVGTSAWFAAGLILLIVVLFTALVMRPWSTRYKRFVSQPLPDGSRYTFLYPAHLRDIQENGAGASPEVSHSVNVYNMNLTRSGWSRLLRRCGFSVLSPQEAVTVVVIPLKTKRVRERRWSAEWARGGRLRHNEYLVDARTKAQFDLYHDCAADG